MKKYPLRRDRSASLVIEDGQLLLIGRKKLGKEYFSTPGGGVEQGESPADTAVRETWEETNIKVKAHNMLYQINLKNHSKQYFFLCEYLSGEPARGNGEEHLRHVKGVNEYHPQWLSLAELTSNTIYPLEVRDWLVQDMKTSLPSSPRIVDLRVEELRQVA